MDIAIFPLVLALAQACLLLHAAVLAMPVLVLAIQVVLAPRLAAAADQHLIASSPSKPPTTPVSPGHKTSSGSTVVLMPAHNEAAGIAASLKSIFAQLGPNDRVLVVADNCSDSTAAVAHSCGAQVIERQHATLRGKSYALDYGIRHLVAQAHESDVVIIVDADCIVWPGALDALAHDARSTGRAVQALYLMSAPDAAGLTSRIAEFAWLVRNQVRPLGWHRLGLPCQLMGSGMAFPWQVIASAELASGALAEDMQLGLQLAEQGLPPLFCPHALVTSEFPVSVQAQASQRTRWEHGHLAMLLAYGPGLLTKAIRQCNANLAALAADLMVPPLVSLALLVTAGAMGTLAISVITYIAGLASTAPQAMASSWVSELATTSWGITAYLCLYMVLAVSIGLTWHRHGRDVLTGRDWLSLPCYVLAKLPMYTRFVTGRREQRWIRTERDEQPPLP